MGTKNTKMFAIYQELSEAVSSIGFLTVQAHAKHISLDKNM